MARPKKDIIEYFPHPVKNGTRMFIMEQTYGDKGYVAYYKLLELLGASEGHYLDFNKDKDRLFFCAAVKVDNELAMRILLTLSELGSIDKTLWFENKIIWCQDLVDSVADLYKKRNRNLPTPPVNIVYNTSNEGVSDSRNNQSIEEDIKGDQIKENDIESRKLKFSDTLKPYIPMYGREMLLDFYYYWSEENKSNSKFKQELQATWNLDGRLRTWVKNDKNFKNGKSITGSYQSNKSDVAELVRQARGTT